MTLTQTQLEEAMKPVQFDKDVVSVGDRAGSVSETGMSSSSIAKDNSLPSATSPISCLLAGEKIQFGKFSSHASVVFKWCFLSKCYTVVF